MARIKVHVLCRLPLSECICPDDDDLDEPQAAPDPSFADGEECP